MTVVRALPAPPSPALGGRALVWFYERCSASVSPKASRAGCQMGRSCRVLRDLQRQRSQAGCYPDRSRPGRLAAYPNSAAVKPAPTWLKLVCIRTAVDVVEECHGCPATGDGDGGGRARAC